MCELLGLEADARVKLHLEPLAGTRLDPLAVDALVLLTGPGIFEFVQLKALILQTLDIRLDALRITGLSVLKGIPDRVRHKRNSLLRREVRLLHHSVDLLFDAVAAFQAVLEADQVPVWVLTFRRAQRRRDPFLLPVDDPVARCFKPAVDGAVQDPVAIPVPGTRRVIGPVGRRAFLRRPPALVLPPHPPRLP